MAYRYDDIITKVEPQGDSSGLVVSVNDVKSFLRLDDVSSEEDILIEALINSATDIVSGITGRTLLTQTYKIYLDKLPTTDLLLPVAPVISISSITYQDSNNATQTLDSSLYYLDNKALGPTLSRAYNQTFPTTYPEKNAVTITLSAGYGSGSSVPETIRHCIKLIVAHFYERREFSWSNGLPHIASSAYPQIVNILLANYIIPRM